MINFVCCPFFPYTCPASTSAPAHFPTQDVSKSPICLHSIGHIVLMLLFLIYSNVFYIDNSNLVLLCMCRKGVERTDKQSHILYTCFPFKEPISPEWA